MSTTSKTAAPRSPAGRSRAAPQKLPRGGRHPLTQAAVAASQRERMLRAIVKVVADKGYTATTVADVIGVAGVSRRTFYEQFASIEACFLAAYDDGLQELLAAIREAMRGAPKGDWRERSRLGIAAYLDALAAGPPGAAWTYTVEVLGAGRKALARRAAVMAQWTAQWRALQEMRRATEAEVPDVEDACLLALVGGIEELVRECLRRRGVRHLPGLVHVATDLSVRVLGGAQPGG
ncbi:TetR/AcrR family transcriptional regulator [Aquabacterium sp. A7-Y]|uniref:TetR/AcrR family transcriptional regulator n=1 Tax=Aquabacterium sp. A7-Y TaxID=1349605 RepID=UPI00223DF608|nr:TetR/AcrR family transcriptional regulator [Aquabacterium sp. A7-Y]MCW7540238.1 TetR/AcrR family transcriptional regulator [Aquabacterium sp. A7-Y]